MIIVGHPSGAPLRAERGGDARRCGRPSKYRPWMCETIVELGEQGLEVVEFAVALNVGRATLYRWADANEEFRDALTRAREAAECFHIRAIRRQLQMPASETNASAYLSYMARRFLSWRDSPESNPVLRTPVSVTLASARRSAARKADE